MELLLLLTEPTYPPCKYGILSLRVSWQTLVLALLPSMTTFCVLTHSKTLVTVFKTWKLDQLRDVTTACIRGVNLEELAQRKIQAPRYGLVEGGTAPSLYDLANNRPGPQYPRGGN